MLFFPPLISFCVLSNTERDNIYEPNSSIHWRPSFPTCDWCNLLIAKRTKHQQWSTVWWQHRAFVLFVFHWKWGPRQGGMRWGTIRNCGQWSYKTDRVQLDSKISEKSNGTAEIYFGLNYRLSAGVCWLSFCRSLECEFDRWSSQTDVRIIGKRFAGGI